MDKDCKENDRGSASGEPKQTTPDHSNDKETIGVDDKLIGDDLEFKEAQQIEKEKASTLKDNGNY